MPFRSPASTVKQLDLDHLEAGEKRRLWLHCLNNKIGEAIRLPVIVARGKKDGPVLGITAAVHGNELNGIPMIQKLFEQLDVEDLAGTLVGVLVVNVPGLLLEQRNFNDGTDLNHRFPGSPNGNLSAVFTHRLVERVIKKLDYLIDLHTASFGRVNSYYVRADMSCEATARMARLQNPQIIVDNPANDYTLRGAAGALGVKAVTLELQDPHLFQHAVIEVGLQGIRNVMHDLGMTTRGEIVCPIRKTILCRKSYWTFTDEGGILEVFPKVTDIVKAGETVAEVRTIFGEVMKSYTMPEDGVIVGRSVNPLNQTGSRIIHIGTQPREIDCLVDDQKS